MRLDFALALGWLVATRVLELRVSARHARALTARGGAVVANDRLGALVAAHVTWMLGLVVEEALLGPAAVPAALRGFAAAVFVAAELARLWCVRSLGERWTSRVIVLPNEPLVGTGPYRFMRHPNYLAVAASVAALPVALALPWTAVLTVPPKLIALRARIRVEDAALAAAGGARAG